MNLINKAFSKPKLSPENIYFMGQLVDHNNLYIRKGMNKGRRVTFKDCHRHDVVQMQFGIGYQPFIIKEIDPTGVILENKKYRIDINYDTSRVLNYLGTKKLLITVILNKILSLCKNVKTAMIQTN